MHKFRPIFFTFIALLLGAMLTFSFAPYEIFPFAIFAPAGLFALWLHASPFRAFWLGLFFGLGFFGSGVYWVFHSIHTFGDVPAFLAGLITFLFIIILAFFPALTGGIANYFFPSRTNSKIILVYPACWVISEWVRSWIFTGFPWLMIGYSQTNSPLSGFAPIFGVFGISLATLFSSSLIVNALYKCKQKNFRAGYFNLFGIVCIWILGGLLTLIPWTHISGKPITVSLVQGNIPQAIKWSPEYLQLSLDRYVELSEPLWGKSQLIIWPEAAIPMALQEAGPFIDAIENKALASGSTLIFGIPIQVETTPGYYNGIITLGESRQSYLKHRLVPFGEFIPTFPLVSRFFNFMSIPMSNMISGGLGQPPLKLANTKILPSICYEIAYPEYINTADKETGLLLTITNDAWFGKSSAEAQHLQMAAMRAQELRRPALFVSNDGITAIITPYGKIEAAAPQYQSYVLSGSIQPMTGTTPWMRFSMDSILLILFILIIVAVFNNRRSKQSEQ